MRSHVFNYGEEFRVSRIVLKPKLVALGMGASLHPFFRDIWDWYKIAPVQLSSNGYKMAIALYMMYISCGFEPPSMHEFNHFFIICQSSLGYFYLIVWRSRNKKGFSEGKTSNVKRWKYSFFYVYNTSRARLHFNTSLSNHFLGRALFSSNFIFIRPNSIICKCNCTTPISAWGSRPASCWDYHWSS